MDKADSMQKKDQETPQVQQAAGFGKGAFFSGKRKNNSDQGAAKCCSGGGGSCK